MSDGAPRRREYRDVDVSGQEWGSDLIADLLKSSGFEYVSFNPGASFRGIEESIVNYNDNVPKVIETTHEGLSVSIAHGYAKAAGEPAACVLHDVVGTMHGAMSLFNAYVDRVPVLALSGTGPMRKSKRRPWIDWIHTANVQGNIVREYVKWDDQPVHVDGVLESYLRALKVADTPPKGPTYVTFDHDIQEGELAEPVEIPDLEKFEPPARMGPDGEAIERAADLLVEADRPVVLTDQIGDSREAVDALVELAETLGAAVIDPRQRRYNFPNTHPLYLPEAEVHREADAVLAVDVWSVNQLLKDVESEPHELSEAIDGDFALVEVGTDDLGISSLTADYYATRETDVSILADSELAVPALTDAISERVADDTRLGSRIEERREEYADLHEEERARFQSLLEEQWDETPISLARLTAEVGETIAGDPWVLVNSTFGTWTHRLWEIDEYDQYTGGYAGGGGVGYGIGAAIGSALAYEGSDRIPINLQPDGDLLYYPGGLWTVAHYDIPMFTVVHNNRTYYNSTAHRMRLAEYRGRDASYERALIGTGLWDPVPDYATMAESMGVSGYGPVEDPAELGPTLRDAWDEVTSGSPVLVDVVSGPR